MNYIKNLSLNNKIFIIFTTLIFLNYIFFNYRLTFRQNGYITADWLYNYQGGFTRRGFIGEIIFNLSVVFNLNSSQILNIVFIVSSFIFFLFLFFFYLVVKNYLRSYFLLLYLFLPSTLLFTFFDILAVGRKDSLILLFFSLYSYFLITNKLKNYYIKVLLIILIIINTLSHELIFFFTPYIFFLKLLSNHQFRINFSILKNLYFELLLFFTSLFCIILLIFLSTPDGTSVCNSLLKLNLSQSICGGVIKDINLGGEISVIKNIFNHSLLPYLFEKNYFRTYGIIILLNFLPIIFFLFRKKESEFLSSTLFYILFSFISFGSTMPVLLIVNDWCRYLNIHFINHALLFIFLLKNYSDTNVINFKTLTLIKKLSIIIIIFLYLTTWFMPHCCRPEIGGGYKSLYDRIYFRLTDESFDTHKFGKDYPRLFIRKILNLN